jgi:hypothetical protein
MNDIQITSLEAYAAKVHPNLGKRQAVVLQYLRTAGPHTNAEIAQGARGADKRNHTADERAAEVGFGA